MPRLIYADDAIRKMESTMDMQDLYLPIHFKEVIDEVPTIEERKGKWETEIRSNRDGTKSAYYACSVCGVYALDEYKFCPNCGARMVDDDIS